MAYIKLLESFDLFFSRQVSILSKEIITIENAINYYMNSNEKVSAGQELNELDIIYRGITSISSKAKILNDQFYQKKPTEGTYTKLIENISKAFDNSHISILVITDSKISQLEKLFDELNFYKRSYYNLIDSREFSYIPSPKYNKRFRNSNLGLYLNKQINDIDNGSSFRSLVSKFYQENNFEKIEENTKIKIGVDDFKKVRFFSTWSHSTEHYIKEFKNNEKFSNRYISMSYAYLDKPIFQPIAYHEISHAMKHEKLSPSNTVYLYESLLPFKGKNLFKKKDPLDDLYKEILCDLSAAYSTGYTYIISLIHIGFFEFKDLFIESKEFDPSDTIDDLEQFKIPSNDNLSPKKFDFNVNNIYLTVRLLILIDLYEKLGIKNTYVEGIKFMINIIFPNPYTREQNSINSHPNFLTIYEFSSVKASDYKQARNLIYSLYEKFKTIILTKRLINNFEKNRIKEKVFQQNINTLIINNFEEKIKDNFEENIKYPFQTIYDFLWYSRENNLTDGQGKLIKERDFNRFFNVYSLFYDHPKKKLPALFNHLFNNIFKQLSENKEKVFYDLEFIKYKTRKGFHPFVEYLKPRSTIKSTSECKISYIFAPYDFAILKERNRDNSNPFPKEKYFIDRHSLFLIEEFNKKTEKKKKRAYSTIIQIKLDNMFSFEENISLVTFLIEYMHSKKHLYNNCKIFKSLGGEDYIVYVDGISIYDSKFFSKYLQSEYKKHPISVEDLILLSDRRRKHIFYDEKQESNFKIISFAKINNKHKDSKNFFNIGDVSPRIVDHNLQEEMKIPTNRFDYIVNWKKSNKVVQHVFDYLKKHYYEDDTEKVESFFSDFNIEIMHTYHTNNDINVGDIIDDIDKLSKKFNIPFKECLEVLKKEKYNRFDRNKFSKNGNNGKVE